MKDKLRLLTQLNVAGVGYCSHDACHEDVCGVGIAWGDVLDMDISVFEDLAKRFL